MTGRGGGTGKGRQPILDSQGRRLERVQWKVPPDVLERLNEMSERTGTSVVALVRELLGDGLTGMETMMTITATLDRPPSQAVQAKAAQYLLERRVQVDHVDRTTFSALVYGSSHNPYQVTCIGGQWRCGCPATVDCAHLLGAQVVAPERFRRGAESTLTAERGDPFALLASRGAGPASDTL
jgi:predicted DNA-binding protein